MSITNETELLGMKKVSEAVAFTLKEMCKYAQPGMTTKELDDFGGKILANFGAFSAPFKTYQFPGIPVSVLTRNFAMVSPQNKEN
jgi:methionyl aminopeptidase